MNRPIVHVDNWSGHCNQCKQRKPEMIGQQFCDACWRSKTAKKEVKDDGYGDDDFGRWLHSPAAYEGVHQYHEPKPKGIQIEAPYQQDRIAKLVCVWCGIPSGRANSWDTCPKRPKGVSLEGRPRSAPQPAS